MANPAPSPAQTAIIDAAVNGKGNLLVQARAGSGKTALLAMVCTALIEQDPSRRLIALAFGRKNAKDFEHRLPARVESSTLNSLGWRAVQRQFPHAILGDKVERDRALAVLKAVPGDRGKYAATTLAKLVRLCKGWLVTTAQEALDIARKHDLLPEPYMQITPSAWAEFAVDCLELSKVYNGAVSYADQLWLPVVLGLPVAEYDFVMIDETQDLNRCQVALVLRVMAPGARALAVGDQRQSIYAFTGADVRSMSRLQTALQATEFPLSVSYRCDRAIVEEAQRFVPDFEASPYAGEGTVTHGASVNDLIQGARGGDWVVSRSNAPLVKVMLKLIAAGQPAQMLGRKEDSSDLLGLVNKAKVDAVPALLAWLATHSKKERERLVAADKEELVESVVDRVETITSLCEGLDTVAELTGRINTLFSEEARSNAVVLASTHKAKGMEADRVWLLWDTYSPGRSEEADNLCYVGITRARHELVYVLGAKQPSKWQGKSGRR